MIQNEIQQLPEKQRLKLYDEMLDYYDKDGLIELTEEQISDFWRMKNENKADRK